jgi:hypothetical protein
MAMHSNVRLCTLILSSLIVLTPLSAMAQQNNRYYYSPNTNGEYQVYSAQTRINPQPDSTYYSDPAAQSYSQAPIETRLRNGTRDAWANKPVKKTAMGAVIGLGAAALKSHNLLHGTVVGLAAGAGFGLMDESRYFSGHPLLRRTGKGAIIGIAAASATGAAALLPALAVGAGVGAGIHLLNRL